MTTTRTYQVRTYGCQMNVHDSERISGLLEDAGYVRAETDEAIARLSRTLPDRLRLRYIGPQPPYSFVDGELTGDSVWA